MTNIETLARLEYDVTLAPDDRGALRAHLAAVEMLVEAARKIVAYDETYQSGETRFDTSIGVGIDCGDLRDLRDAIKEVTS